MTSALKVEITREPHARDLPLPRAESEGAAGLDLRAAVTAHEPLTLSPGERRLIPTGWRIALPKGFEAQVRPRSGLALRHGILIPNAPGTIDADYRGECCVPLINHGKSSFTVEPNMRIAQMIIAPVVQATFVVVEELDETNRGAGGFGSTGS